LEDGLVQTRKGILVTAIWAIVVLFFVGAAYATTWYVPGDGSGVCTIANPNCNTIQAAIDAATSGDTIVLGSGTFTEHGIVIDKDLTIQGQGASATIVQAAATAGGVDDRVFEVNSGVTATLEDLTVQNGKRSWASGYACPACGGGIRNLGNLTLTRCTIKDNAAIVGGGIHNEGTLAINESTLTGNRGKVVFDGYGGGVYNNGGTVTITDSVFTDNVGSMKGGGIYNASGTVTVTDTIFSGNSASSEGGGICNNAGTLTVTACTFSSNSAPGIGWGGGIKAGGTVTVTDSTFSDNTGGQGGGAIAANGPSLTVTGSTFSGNSAKDGGGIENMSSSTTVSLTNCTFFDNNASQNGGAVHTWGVLHITNCTFVGNSADPTGTYFAVGGAIWTLGFGSDTLIHNTIIANNTPGNCAVSGCLNLASTKVFSTDATCGWSGCGYVAVTLQGLALGALADNGGPTETIALLPGSVAIDAGNDAVSPGTDQRGIVRPRGTHCDVGAYESRTFSLAKTGGDPQSAFINTAFSNPLSLDVTSGSGDPVDGGRVKFTAPGSGASITPATNYVTISGGAASLTATANGTPGGPYIVTASAAGASASVDFTLTNLQPRTLTVQGAGNGKGTVTNAGINCAICCGGTASGDCTEMVVEGTSITLTAGPDANSTFGGWSGDCSGTDQTVMILMDADKTCTATFELQPYAPGDVSGDGVIDLIDVRMCHQIATHFRTGTPLQQDAADVDGDGDVDMDDATILSEYVLGIRTTLP
jgi:predicted outer membrane repeat protein